MVPLASVYKVTAVYSDTKVNCVNKVNCVFKKQKERRLAQIRVSQKNHDKLVELAADLQKSQKQGKKKIVTLDKALSFLFEKYEESKK